jgi:CubicO group peptidase (beta-lactamase class C family)
VVSLTAFWRISCAAPALARSGLMAVAEPPVPLVLQPFEQEMRRWLERFGVAQATLAVMRDDRLVFARGYGERHGGQRVNVHSLSKAITAACIATLVRERKLRLDAPIGGLLSPLYARYGKPADDRVERVTVAELLTHRGGWSRRAGGNGWAPGLPDLLRHVAPHAATAHMLLPAIFRVRLAHEPGTQYEYSNIGYLLLGQIIEVVTGESYVKACGRRVLVPAGIKDAQRDATWGGLSHAAGGWWLSGPEYLAFLRLLRPRHPDFLSPELRAWLTDGTGKWIDERGGLADTLGVMVSFPAVNLFHGGAGQWRQSDAAGGPIALKEGTWAVLAGDGTAWVASFDTVTADEDPEAFDRLVRALWQARRAVATWPVGDLFASFGIGTVAVRK